ncbi:MAG: DUF190 domain-containing protein [Chloroflexi bacterium]|nr:DUF190 domain-containing protein [Chloroflexota bacterium]
MQLKTTQPVVEETTEATPASAGLPARGEARLLRIFIEESSRYRGHPLYEAILELLKREGCAGATVTRGVAGFGGHHVTHTGNLVDVLPQLPLIVEVVESPAQLEKIRPRLEEMVEEGLIFVQDIEIWKYSYRPRLKELPANATVSQVMTQAVVSVQPDTPLAEVVRLLLDQDYFKALPVVEANRRVVGIITDGDLLHRGGLPQRLSVLETLDRENLHHLLTELHHNPKTAAEIMTSPVVTLQPETSLRDAAELMVTQKLKRLPVINAEGGLVGIIGRLDVLRVVATTKPTRPQATSPQPELDLRKEAQIYRVARDIMVTDVPTVLPDLPVAELLERLIGSPLRRLIVVDHERKILGIVTDADLVARVSVQSKPGVLATLALSLGFRRSGMISQLDLNWRSNAKTAEELMTREVITVGPEEPLEKIVKLMVEHSVKYLPVQAENGVLLGVVLRRELLRAVTESMSG